MELTLHQRKVHIFLQYETIKVEKKKTNSYQVLLDRQLQENVKLKRKLNSTNSWIKKHPSDPKRIQRQKEIDDANKEAADVRENHKKTLKYMGELHQELDELKKKEAQRIAKEKNDALTQLITSEKAGGGSITLDDHHARVAMLEARIQTLQRDHDLYKRETELNNGWVDNQQSLAEALERVGNENETLKARNQQLEETLQSNAFK